MVQRCRLTSSICVFHLGFGLAFRYLGDSDLIKALRESGVNLDYFYKLLWRHVFIVEILKHRFFQKKHAKRA